MTYQCQFWSPGEGIRDIDGRVSGDHVVIAGLFLASGAVGVIQSHRDNEEFAVLDVKRDVPVVSSLHGDLASADAAFRARVVDMLAR